MGPVVYKPLWSTPYLDQGETRTIWVRRVAASEIGDGVAACPHLFQKHVPKIADIRVAVVGQQLFATRIDIAGEHTDWRMDYDRLSFIPIRVPDTVRQGINAYMTTMVLTFAAFDFVQDQDGEWWFLECNPNGQWAFVGPATTASITRALADVFEKGTRP